MRCLLRACSWITGVKGPVEAEEALINALASDTESEHGNNTTILESLLGGNLSTCMVLQLVEALARRRVANCARLQHDVVLRVFTFRQV